MILTLTNNGNTVYLDTGLIAFVFADGGSTYITMNTEPIEAVRVEPSLSGIVWNTSGRYGTQTIKVAQTYSSIKSASTGYGFAEFTHATYTNVLVNCSAVHRVNDVTGNALMLFRRGASVLTTTATAAAVTAIATALAASGGGTAWGSITGTLSAQTDLQGALDAKVPYTGATGDVDLNNYSLNAKSLHIKGTGGNGNLGLKHQSGSITASASESTLGANSSGNPVWKNDGNAIQAIMLENAAITGATKTKITYDSKGLVTSGSDATTADIADSTNKRYVTDAQLTVIGNTSGTNTGDQFTSTTASRLIGRGSASAGAAQEITLGTNLSMSGTTLNASFTDTGITQLTGDVTAGPGNGSQAATLASVITAGGPTGSSSVVPVITYDAKGRLTAVSTATITPAAIGAPSGSGTSSGTNTGDQFTATTASRLIGRGSAGGAGDAQEITLGTGLSMSGTTLNSTGGSLSTGVLQVASGLSSSLQTVTDQTPTNSVLQLSTTRVKVNGPFEVDADSASATQTAATISTIGSSTNIGLILKPKGTGFLSLRVPDGTATGGNARGNYAVDLQIQSTNAAYVASGAGSAVVGGNTNRATQANSSVLGGNDNSCTGAGSSIIGSNTCDTSGTNSAIAGGNSCSVNGSGSFSTGIRSIADANYSQAFGSRAFSALIGQTAASGGSANAGFYCDAQRSTFSMLRQITGTAKTELFVDGSSTRAIITLNFGAGSARAWQGTAQIVAITSVVGNGTGTLGDVFSSFRKFTIKRIGTSTSLVGSVETIGSDQTNTSMASAVVDITANDTNEALKIEFTPPTTAGSTTVTKVHVAVNLSEIGY